MFGGRRYDYLVERIKAVELLMRKNSSVLQAQINLTDRKNKLLMDYLNVRIESGDRIVPKDNAQG
jgi:hypothetical protein